MALSAVNDSAEQQKHGFDADKQAMMARIGVLESAQVVSSLLSPTMFLRVLFLPSSFILVLTSGSSSVMCYRRGWQYLQRLSINSEH